MDLQPSDYASIAAAGAGILVAGATYRLARATRTMAEGTTELGQETLRARIDQVSHRLRVVAGPPDWPPFRTPLSAGDVESRWSPGHEFVLPGHATVLLTLRAVGVITNEGRSGAKVLLDECGGFVGGRNPFNPQLSHTSPVPVAPNTYIIPPGESGIFYFDAVKTIHEWVSHSSNEDSTVAELTIESRGLYDSGVRDTTRVTMQAVRPLEPTEGDASRWRIPRAISGRARTDVSFTHRRYGHPKPPPM